MEKWKNILEERLIKNRIYVPGYRSMLHLVEYNGDLLFSVINGMLDENDPLFAKEITGILKEPLLLYGRDIFLFSSYLKKFTDIFGKKYGIKEIELRKAIEGACGSSKFYKYIGLKNHKIRTQPRSGILYKSRDKLLEYIITNTSKNR